MNAPQTESAETVSKMVVSSTSFVYFSPPRNIETSRVTQMNCCIKVHQAHSNVLNIVELQGDNVQMILCIFSQSITFKACLA